MEKFFPREKILNYGNPIRHRFGRHDELKKEKFIKKNQINLSNNTLLFLGGSLGSNVINQFVINNSSGGLFSQLLLYYSCGVLDVLFIRYQLED